MQRIRVRTAQNVEIAYELASIGDRIVAFLLDIILVGFTYMGVTSLLNALNIPVTTLFSYILLIPFMFYHLIMELFFQGQSIGKMILKIKVVMLDGSQPSLGAYVLRWMFRLFEIGATTGIGATITILINGKGQRLGDLAAGTTVVKLQQNKTVKRHELIKNEEVNYQVTFNAADRLADNDIAVVLEALKLYKTSGNRHPVEVTENKIKEILSISSDLPSVSFLYTIVRDYNHLTSR